MRWQSATVLIVCLLAVYAELAGARRNRIRKRPPSRHRARPLTIRWPAHRQCGYAGCPAPKPGMLNVHIVPHTHDDVGWLKTVDQYYYGTRARITKVSVQNILDSVVEALLADPQRRFIYVESAFFFKWWHEQSDDRRDQVRQLVDEGRLEFIGGAWSMNDEATVHYQSTVDQFTWGLRQLNDTFGECARPRVGWQIDPFGHSREQASLFAQMGFDGLFIGRLDYQDKAVRLLERRAEMIWHGSANLGEHADLFTGVLFNNYGPPPGFCFDVLCNDEPIVDAVRSPENNVERRIDEFIHSVQQQSAAYRTDNVIVTMGGDFTYTDAHIYYKNMDKLLRTYKPQIDEFIAYVQNMSAKYRTDNVIITMGEDFNYLDANVWFRNLDKLNHYANARQQNGSLVNLFYSTPSCYLKALHDADLEWTTKSDDFFPYASDPHAYWTGYFTSRPTLKRFERQGNHFLQVCKQLSVFAPHKTSRSFDFHLNFMRESMGVMQHHDAVTGTEQQHVANDYARRLMIALRACGETVRNVLNQLTTGKATELRSDLDGVAEQLDQTEQKPIPPHYEFAFDTCYGLNISACPLSERAERFLVTVYNPLVHSTFQYVRVPVPSGHYTVRDYRNVAVVSTIVPISRDILAIHYRSSEAVAELVFAAVELPPLGYKSYFVSREPQPDVRLMMQADEAPNNCSDDDDAKDDDGSFSIGNKHVRIGFSATGALQTIAVDGATTPSRLEQHFFYYEAALGNNEIFANRSSGAYIFRPNCSREVTLPQPTAVRVVRSGLVEEVHQTFGDWLSQVIRVYRDERHVEFDWLVGPIPIDDGRGKEIVTRFGTDVQSKGVFYTDSNGREMLRRVRNERDTWNVSIAEEVAGNYYPVTARIAVEDVVHRLAVLTDRAQGGSSLVDGAVDLMIHRRLLHDDAFGVGEALNETAFGRGLIARGQHYLTFGAKTATRPSIEAQERFLQLKQLLPAWTFFSDATNLTYDEWREKYTNIYSGITLSLPQNVHLLTLEPWRDGTVLIRLEHILERLEDVRGYSEPVTFNLGDVLHGMSIVELRETTLAANQWLDEAKPRLRFRAAKNEQSTESESSEEGFVSLLSSPVKFGDNDIDPLEITLQPMQIRTFVLTLEQNV